MSRPIPSEPWDSHASTETSPAPTAAMNTTVSTVESRNVIQRRGRRMAIQSSRWFSPSRQNHQPASRPATTGMASTPGAKAHGSPVGTAASTGTSGRGPSAVWNGDVVVPAPRENPAPVAQASAQTTMLGRYPSCSAVRAVSPAGSVPRFW